MEIFILFSGLRMALRSKCAPKAAGCPVNRGQQMSTEIQQAEIQESKKCLDEVEPHPDFLS